MAKSDQIKFGMELFTNLDISWRQEKLENNQRKLQKIFETKPVDLIARRLYFREVPFTIEQFEHALVQLDDKKVNILGWRASGLVKNWVKLNLSYLYREREREVEDNFQINFKKRK